MNTFAVYILGFSVLTGLAHNSETAQNNREQERIQWCNSMIDTQQLTDSVVMICFHTDGSRK